MFRQRRFVGLVFIMSYLKERIKHAVRFRHKRGFGVHSPFMFNLILNVIRDKEKQYTYPVSLEKRDGLGHHEKKVFRLLSRLTRYLDVHSLACFGVEAPRIGNYLRAMVPGAEIQINGGTLSPEVDFIYLARGFQQYLPDEPERGELFACYGKRKCVVITDIYKSRQAGRLWRQAGEKATVRLDMMWYGILLFDEKLQKGKYNLII